MKRIRVYRTGPPEVMELEEADPPRPAAGQILVRVEAAGVNPVDTYVRSATQGYSPELPYTPGADAAGVVESVGQGITRLKPGDRVYGGAALTGSYAEAALFDQHRLFPLPEEISFEQGACLAIPYGTACRALFQKAKVRSGETVLVHGASGGVGLAAVQLARTENLTVFGTAGSPQGRRLVEAQGAARVFDHTSVTHGDEILSATGGRGVDVILEMLANRNLGEDLKILAPFGRVVVIGSRGPVQIDPRDAMKRDASVLGMVLKNAPPDEFEALHRRIGSGLRSGALRPVVGKTFALSEAPRAHEAVMSPPARGNIVLIP